MRLKQREVENITSVIKSLDGHAQIYLFGSRIDDTKRGGDIDILIISQTLCYDDKIKILQRLYDALGEQKIHIIISKNITKNEWDAKGTAEIDDLNSKTGMSIRESDYDSLDSFASSTLGRPPKAGDEIPYQNFRITVEEVQGKKVLKAKIVKSTLAK